jgi:hypothetical protein
MANYIEIEIPYGTKLLISVHGSEALMKGLLAGQLIERTWRDDAQESYKSDLKLQATYVDYKVLDRPQPTPDPETSTPETSTQPEF